MGIWSPEDWVNRNRGISTNDLIPDVTNDSFAANGISTIASGLLGEIMPEDFGPYLGNLFSSGISTSANNITLNLFKGEALTKGLGVNLADSLAGTATGLAGYGLGLGISALGGDSRLSRGIGTGIGKGIGLIGSLAVSNLVKGEKAFKGISDSIKAIKDFNQIKKMDWIPKNSTVFKEAKHLSNLGKWNFVGLGGEIIGTGLQAALGPSKEYLGKYGNITQTMDTAYDLIGSGLNVFGPVGQGISGLMTLNKGLSNLFGSTDGMTRTDAILGSAFMPAPVKWLNMLGASTTSTFNDLSWQNTEKTNSFMGNAFGNLGERFDKAREEAGKTYGTFSQGAYNKALNNINFANNAWGKILSLADLNELQNIRSLYMTSINNLRYAQDILGGWSPLARGKYGMKILNNATNHNIGMRLLSGAALIDNKQMILCNVPG